jgi:hypothetical protein
VLHQLRSVRRSSSRESLTSLVVAIALPRLDYCNAVLAGLPNSHWIVCCLFSKRLSALSSRLTAATMLRHCWSNSTGCLRANAWSSSSALSHVAVATVRHRLTWPAISNVCPASKHGDGFVLRRQQHYSFPGRPVVSCRYGTRLECAARGYYFRIVTNGLP